MKDPIFITIIAGVTVFVLGQFFLKLVLEPLVEFKKCLGELSALFLREQAKITNANCNEEIVNEIKKQAASLLAARHAIPCYWFFSFIRWLPSTTKLNKACGSLNIISYHVMENNPDTREKPLICNDIMEEMNNISTNLNVIISYSRL